MKAVTLRMAVWGWAMCLALAALWVPPAWGACRTWEHDLGAPTHSNIFAGTLGHHTIRMMLHLDTVTRRFSGAYGYNDQPGTLTLGSDIKPGQPGVHLVARDKQGHVTGYFSLRFFFPRPTWMTTSEYKQVATNTCDFLTGTWKSPQGKSRSVSLKGVGELTPDTVKERKMNSATAYKLRKAMLDGNRKAFAALLHYPFHSYYNHPSTNIYSKSSGNVLLTWKTPAEVIKNYKKIVKLTREEIRKSVPHFVLGYFMHGQVYIKDGKVTYICAGMCPLNP